MTRSGSVPARIPGRPSWPPATATPPGWVSTPGRSRRDTCGSTAPASLRLRSRPGSLSGRVMPERPGPPGLEAEAAGVIAGQYSDRPRLRPVLDAVLAALPALGPVTVQARKTMVSLVTPRRTFAVIQATTKSRVDLGLRLEHERPGGRLLAARDLGAATARIPLTRPEDVDAEVLDWLRRAYAENAAPPPPRRPARRPAAKLGTLTVVIEATSLPGLTWPSGDDGDYHNLQIGLATKSKERPTLAVPGKPWL